MTIEQAIYCFSNNSKMYLQEIMHSTFAQSSTGTICYMAN